MYSLDYVHTVSGAGKGAAAPPHTFRQDRFWDSAKFVEKHVAGGLLL